jgi:hypothetical protein
VIDTAATIYASSEELSLSLTLNIAGGVSVVSEDGSCTMPGRCGTTVDGGGSCQQVNFGPERLSMMLYLALCFLTSFGEDGGDASISGGGR